MLQLKHKGNNYELTDRSITVGLTGREITVGDTTIGDSGEYEVSNVEVVYGSSAALLVWEHLQITYVFSLESPGIFEKDQFSSTDAMIIADGLGELTKATFDELLGAYDPKVIIMSAAAPVEAGLKNSLKVQDMGALKLAKANLPEEGREIYLAS